MSDKINSILNCVVYAGVLTQTREVFQIVQLSIAILISLTIFIPKVYKWLKKALKDGKIDSEELDELQQIGEETIENVKEITK